MDVGRRVLVIGGDAAGLKTAARLKRIRPESEITVFERFDTISYAACGLPYYLSGDIDNADELLSTAWGELKTPEYFQHSKGIDVKTGHEVIGIRPDKKSIFVRRKGSDSSSEFSYDTLVIATGASPIILDLSGCSGDGICCFTKPDDAKKLRQLLERNEIGRVAVIGGGYIGLELCEAFGALWGVEVVLVEQEQQVMCPNLDPEMARLVHSQLEEQGVKLHLGCHLARVQHNENQLVIILDNGQEEPVDHVVMCVGVRPNARLAFEAGLALGFHGGILVDGNGRTSQSDIYAVGDCVELPTSNGHRLLPLGSIANRMGRLVANTIAGLDEPGLAPPHGAGVVKVFDLNVGSIGLSAERAKAANLEIDEYWGCFPANAHYYPESTDVLMKVVRQRGGKLLGLQVAGKGEVVRWINAFGQILDLADGDTAALLRFEHAYAPPFATALDPLHHFAGMIEAGAELQVNPGEWAELVNDASLTWVNLLAESERSSINLPHICGTLHEWGMSELRERFGELPRTDVVLFCAKGPRSYEGTRFLRQQGIEARYLAGGVMFVV